MVLFSTLLLSAAYVAHSQSEDISFLLIGARREDCNCFELSAVVPPSRWGVREADSLEAIVAVVAGVAVSTAGICVGFQCGSGGASELPILVVDEKRPPSAGTVTAFPPQAVDSTWRRVRTRERARGHYDTAPSQSISLPCCRRRKHNFFLREILSIRWADLGGASFSTYGRAFLLPVVAYFGETIEEKVAIADTIRGISPVESVGKKNRDSRPHSP